MLRRRKLGYGSRTRRCEFIEDGAIELAHVLGTARRDPVRILHHRLIAIEATGVANVIRDRVRAGELTTARQARGDQHVRAVTDHEDRLLGDIELAHEALYLFVGAK